MQDIEIPRDRWGRPLIDPPGGGKPKPYTRVSTLSKTLDDKTALSKWMCRQTAIGLAQRPDLVALVASDPDSKRQVGDAVEQAMVAAKSDAAANRGTTIHSFTEQIDRGTFDPTFVDAEMLADLRAYRDTMAPIKIDAIETFVVQDQIEAAGTFDRIVTLPDGRTMVADIKTGQYEPKFPHSATTQIAVYSRGTEYAPGARAEQSLAERYNIDQQHGLLIHLPAGSAKCDLYLLDLEVGWALATVAHRVRAMQKAKPITEYQP